MGGLVAVIMLASNTNSTYLAAVPISSCPSRFYSSFAGLEITLGKLFFPLKTIKRIKGGLQRKDWGVPRQGGFR